MFLVVYLVILFLDGVQCRTEISDILQANVRGGQLSNFSLHEMGINPCLN